MTLCISNHISNVLKKFVSNLPSIQVEYVLKPIAQTVIKMDLTVKADFVWNSRWHSTKEIFWLMVDDQNEIFH